MVKGKRCIVATFAFVLIAMFPNLPTCSILARESNDDVSINHQCQAYRAYAVAEKAKAKIAEGEVYDAILALLEVLPEDKSDETKLYVPQAEAVLRIAIDSLRGCSWKKQVLPLGRNYRLSYHGKYILSEEETDTIKSAWSVIDANTLQEKYPIDLPPNYNYLACSDDDKQLAVGYQSKLLIYDLENGKLISTLYLGDAKCSSILTTFNPIFIDHYLDIGEQKNSFPNVLTQFFKPEQAKKDVQVLDYLPNRNWILYKQKQNGEPKYDFVDTYVLLDINKGKVVWKLTDKYCTPSDINEVMLSAKGNYIVISRWGSFEVINISNNHSRTIATGEDSDHYSNCAVMSMDESKIFQYSYFTDVAHIYDVKTLSCVDSLKNYPLNITSISFDELNTKYIANCFHWMDLVATPYLRFTTKTFQLNAKDISAQLVRNNINNRIGTKPNDTHNTLCYSDGLGHEWECINADFVGYTPDLQYVAIKKYGFRGAIECQMLETCSGICMYKETPEDMHDEVFNFLSYSELLKIARNVVKNMKMSETMRKDYYLQRSKKI